MPAILRFAPSPNGFLHLGHAFSAQENQRCADLLDGENWLRIEDIDPARSREEYEIAIRDDLSWLGIRFDGEQERQSQRVDDYRDALARLADEGLLYRAGLSRGDVKRRVAAFEIDGGQWPRDPDGAPLYPETERERVSGKDVLRGFAGPLRLDMTSALERAGPLERSVWNPETGVQTLRHAAPQLWGDVMLSRADVPTSYHLAVVVDDAALGVTHVVRGQDLEAATDVHVLLQELLGLSSPTYHHHRLILDEEGKKLAKSAVSKSLRDLRAEGVTAGDIRRIISQ